MATSIASDDRPEPGYDKNLAVSMDPEGFDTVNHYTLLQLIGSGGAASVMLAIDSQSDEPRAVKIIPRRRMTSAFAAHGVASCIEEVAIMKKLRHRHIIRLFECIDDPGEDSVYLVMQYAERGSIAQIAGDGTCPPLSTTVVAKAARQIVSALRYTHSHGVVHRDIKPENILLDSEGNAYLADFGVSVLRDADPTAANGTPQYLAPELLQTGKATPASDVWALGVTLFALLFGRLPFFAETLGETIRRVCEDAPMFPPTPPTKARWQPVLRHLLEKDPAHRMTLRELSRSALLDSDSPPSSNESSFTTAGGSSDQLDIEPTFEECIGAITRVPGNQPGAGVKRWAAASVSFA